MGTVWAVVLGASMSGCVTSLGYVPGHVDTRAAPPTYEEVRTWAAKVREGYDTRMTTNRFAGYYGALLAAGAAGAVTGLAAFDAGSAALVGIPIGTAFLASVAGVFQSESKAKVYGYASRYVSDLIAQSDRRVSARQAARLDPLAAEADAADMERAAKTELAAAQTRLASLQSHLGNDLQAAASAPSDKVLQDRAAAAQKQVTEGGSLVAEAETRVKAAEARHERARARTAAWRRHGPMPAAEALSLARQEEAECLERDVLEATGKVAKLLYPLAPDSAEALKAVKAPSDAKSGGAKAEDKPAKNEKPALPSLDDLDLPSRSMCADQP